MNKKVFVSGCYDLLHSGHIEFFRQASSYGDLYVGIGSDNTIRQYKKHEPYYCEDERLFMVQSVKYVKEAYINKGIGIMDFIPTLDIVKPDILIVNTDGDYNEKRELCEKRGIEYIVLDRVPFKQLPQRCSANIKNDINQIPVRIDIAGAWLDQPYVNCLNGGWVITLCIEPTFVIHQRSGLSTSTRNALIHLWSNKLPNIDSETLSYIAFCVENKPSITHKDVSGAQDAIGICTPCLSRHYYEGDYWPKTIEKCSNETIMRWLEEHICLIFMGERPINYSPFEHQNITTKISNNLAKASEDCWVAINKMDLEKFAISVRNSFNAQITMFPSMINDKVLDYIDKYSQKNGVLSWKVSGAGGGGYLILIVENAMEFCDENVNAIPIKIKR